MATELLMPKLGETMLEGLILRWLKKEGDQVSRGEALIEVETDKAISEVVAAVSGRLSKILIPEGASVQVGVAYALVDAEGEEWVEADKPVGGKPAYGVQKPVEQVVQTASPRASGGRVLATPAAKRLARQHGVALGGVKGTGPGGVIGERDVKLAIEAKSRACEVEIDAEVLSLAGARKVIAERMLQSRQSTAHVTTFIDVDVTRVGQLRKELGTTYTTFVVKAACIALKEFPYLNASLEGDKILLHKRIHMGVAVAAGDTLVVPVIQDADRKGLKEIAGELLVLAEKGRNRQLSVEEMQGATFTISNPGVFGALFSTPIINLPQSGILGTGRVSRVPIVTGDQIAIGEVMYLSLTYDHRLVDGGPAAQFVRRLKELLENPDKMLG